MGPFVLAAAGACRMAHVGPPELAALVVSVEPGVLGVGAAATVRAVPRRATGETSTDPRHRPTVWARDPAVVAVGDPRMVAGEPVWPLAARAVGATWVVAESGGRRDSVRVTVRVTVRASAASGRRE